MISCFIFLWLSSANAAVLQVTVKFSQTALDQTFFSADEDRVFGLNVYPICQRELGTEACPGGQAVFEDSLWITTRDNVSTDAWSKSVDLGSSYTGPIVFSLFAPLLYSANDQGKLEFFSSVTACADDLADVEMSLEICGQHGTPWTVDVEDPAATYAFEVFPAFGIGETGRTYVILEQFYSAQLDNSRNISAYVPPSLLQNTVPRPVNIMFVLDGSDAVVQSYSTRTGFEAAQIMGVVPESIMVGITTVEFAYQLDFNQRTYEMTYAEAMAYPSETCISGEYGPTGGTDKLLQWLDEDVIDAVLAELGMLRGEVAITGGSLGGLTSCYAAAARPDVFQRAVCSSPSNCYNFAVGGLAPIIKDSYAATGVKALTVIQFLGHGEIVDDSASDQLSMMIQDDDAWISIGMQHLVMRTEYQPIDSSKGISHPYLTLSAAPANVVMSFLLPAGQHAPSTWEQEFSAALPLLYRASRPANFANRVPKSESLQYYAGLDASSTSSCDANNESFDDAEVYTVIVLLCTAVLCLVAAIAYIFLLRHQIGKTVEASKLVAMSSIA